MAKFSVVGFLGGSQVKQGEQFLAGWFSYGGWFETLLMPNERGIVHSG
jgi:hypothetical protein